MYSFLTQNKLIMKLSINDLITRNDFIKMISIKLTRKKRQTCSSVQGTHKFVSRQNLNRKSYLKRSVLKYSYFLVRYTVILVCDRIVPVVIK